MSWIGDGVRVAAGESRERWWGRPVAACVAAVVLAVAFGAAGCGDEDPRGAAADRPEASAASDRDSIAAAREADEQPPPENPDGTLRGDDRKVVRDWGAARDRKPVVASFVRMQRDFRAGRMAAVCAGISDFGVEQFRPGDTDFYTPCPAKMRAFAAELRRDGVEPVRLRILWVRYYPIVASIWVEDPKGERVRVPFTDLDGSGMRFEIGVFDRPEMLYGHLAGARRYLAR